MDFFFAADGRFSTAARTGPKWGPAEYDGRLFTIIRTDDPAWIAALPDLKAHRKLLGSTGLWLERNVFSAGTLLAAPEAEWIAPASWRVISTGKVFDSEDAAMDAAETGDVIFLVKSNDPQCPGLASVVTDKESRSVAVAGKMLLASAENTSTVMQAAADLKGGAVHVAP